MKIRSAAALAATAVALLAGAGAQEAAATHMCAPYASDPTCFVRWSQECLQRPDAPLCTEPLYYGPGALVWCAIDYVDPVCVTEMVREQTGG